MQYSIKCGDATKQRAHLIILPVFDHRKLSIEAEKVNLASQSRLGNLIKKSHFTGKLGTSLLLFDIPGCFSERILLIGCGKEKDLDKIQFNNIIQNQCDALKPLHCTDVISYLTQIPVKNTPIEDRIMLAVTQSHQCFYQFAQLKTKQKNTSSPIQHMIYTIAQRSERSCAETALKIANAIGQGLYSCRNLGNLPGNLCTPTTLAEHAQKLADSHDTVSIKVFDEPELESMGMNALLSVGRGSQEPSKLIELTYQGTSEASDPYVLIGKGITFDAGGICLKPALNMQDMKLDMCGAATVLGVFEAIAILGLPIHLKVLVASAENMPSGFATRPGDVVVTASKKSVEIINTDAEGRLVLCDAIDYATQFNPKVIIDVATLTGAIIVALGHSYSGLFSSHDGLAKALLKAGENSQDPAWRMPLHPDYQTAMDSQVADLRNVAKTPAAGSCVAAQFLKNFSKNTPWAHLDIAGTGMQQGSSSGRSVALLVHYLMKQGG